MTTQRAFRGGRLRTHDVMLQHRTLTYILSTFLMSRLALLLIGWFSQNIVADAKFFPVERGWLYSPHRLLDIWGRWDTGWYMSIVVDGYSVSANPTQIQSNVAFFPLYPCLVRIALLLVPQHLETPGVILFTGILIANACFLTALTLMYFLILHLGYSDATARRTVFYMAIFPVSFIYSSFYTESLFLLLAVATFYLAGTGKWRESCCAAGLASAARLPGLLLAVPLAWTYMQNCEWKLRNIRRNVTWLLVTPAGLVVYMAYLYRLCGDPLVFLRSQVAWQHQFALPWKTLTTISPGAPYIDRLNLGMSLLFIVLTLTMLAALRMRPYGLFSLSSLLSFLFSGSLTSAMRYCSVMFPAFITLAEFGEHTIVDKTITVLSLVLLGVLMATWSQGYWVV